MKIQSIVPFFSLVALVGCGGPSYKATLAGASEVPPVTSPATGSVTAVLDGTMLDVNGTYKDLSGPAISAHIHGPATATATAGIFCTLTFTEGTPAGTGTLKGECPNFDEATVTNLNGGMFYVNVHTSAHGGGEIRGQISKQ
jgi:hypothetical protein